MNNPLAETEKEAPGAPGIAARWTSSAKVGIGTAYHTGCCAWFTLSHGIIDEIYYPTIDTPNTRDLELLITDGKTFCHEEKRDLDHRVEMPIPGVPFYRLINTDRQKRYAVVKEILADPHRSVILMRVSLRYLQPSWRGRLQVYTLIAPHIGRQGADNIAGSCELSTGDLLHAKRENVHLVMGCNTGFSKRSAGYVGFSDGWKDLRNFKMDWEYRKAGPGNVAMLGQVDLDRTGQFIIGVGFGETDTSAVTALLQSFATPFSEHRKTYIEQWVRSERIDGGGKKSRDVLARVSRMVLLAHEDKTFQGAMVASLSIPWGESKGDNDRGGYHLVWTRDLVHSATALLAAGQTATPLRALIWLAAMQNVDGGVPQNSWTDGSTFLDAIQLDETASLMILATRLRQASALGLFDPWPVIAKAAAFLIKAGPITGQERWEENAGFSPSTLASIIAGMVGGAEFAREHASKKTREFLLEYADWLNAYVEDWTVTTAGVLLPKIRRHYIRITPADVQAAEIAPDPDNAEYFLTNSAGKHRARDIVSADFLQLVRLGLRDANDPLIINSLKVVDRVLKRKLPSGYGWRRYPFDGYGQKKDGGPYDGTGIGRCWPLLTGERGHHAIAAGQSAAPYLAAMRGFASEGNLLPEQVWDEPTSKDGTCRFGQPSGSAMPLCWSHAEYLTLSRSQADGKVFDRVEAAAKRYLGPREREFRVEFWSLRYRRSHIQSGKVLRLITDASARIQWNIDDGPRHGGSLSESGLYKLWFLDLPTEKLKSGAMVKFTFAGLPRWEGVHFAVTLIPETARGGA